MSIQILQYFQIGLLQDIKNKGDEEHHELTKMIDERAQLQQQYNVAIQQKKEIEGRVEEIMKDKNKADKMASKDFKEKDEAKILAQKTQAIVHKLYKAILKVPIVVEATMEEKVLKIGEVIKRFRSQIEDLQL